MAGSYFAITRRQARWVYICSGADPMQVYHDAVQLLQGRVDTYGEDPHILSTAAEHALDTLRVVPESIARQTYQVSFRVAVAEELAEE